MAAEIDLAAEHMSTAAPDVDAVSRGLKPTRIDYFYKIAPGAGDGGLVSGVHLDGMHGCGFVKIHRTLQTIFPAGRRIPAEWLQIQ
jgi:hypothetical protein